MWADEFDGAAGAKANAANWRADIGTDWGNAQLEYDTDLDPTTLADETFVMAAMAEINPNSP